jgi:RNA polymerase sigma factor (sigma-70 family)
VQEVLEKLVPSWDRVEHPDAYARQVMYRLEMRHWRRRGSAEVLTGSPLGASQQDATAAADARMVLEQALRKLPRGQRAVLVLRFFEDLSEAGAAEVLGCSTGTVKSQTFKALRALRSASPELADLAVRTHSDTTTT